MSQVIAAILVCGLGILALAARLAMGLKTDPFVWLIVLCAFGALCFIAYENRAPRRSRLKPASDRMAVGE